MVCRTHLGTAAWLRNTVKHLACAWGWKSPGEKGIVESRLLFIKKCDWGLEKSED